MMKSVTIKLNGSKKEYSFEGPWNGNDVKLALSGFTREYKLYQRALRRKLGELNNVGMGVISPQQTSY